MKINWGAFFTALVAVVIGVVVADNVVAPRLNKGN